MGPMLRAASALGVLSVSALAHAGDATLAEALFRDGKALMNAGDYRAACPKLAESFRQDAATGTLLALALCQEGEGKLASAWASFSAVVGRAQQEGRQDRVKAAREKVAALEPRLPRLTIVVTREQGGSYTPEVKRDGVVVPEAAWSSATPIDPGEHVVEASAPGRAPFRVDVPAAREGERVSVVVPVLAVVSGAAAAPSKIEARATEASPERTAVSAPEAAHATVPAPGVEPERERGMSGLSWAGIGAGALGVASLGVGTYLGVRAMKEDQTSEDAGCSRTTGFCPSERGGLEANEKARQAAGLSTVFFVAGGVLTAGGVALYIVGRPSDSTVESARVRVGVAPGVGSITAFGRF
jgi:hypothetical protein